MKNVLGLINLHENEDLLKEITHHRPLAAVPFGGKFRLIDFVLSNMVNSGIRNIGIVTKRKYRSLMDHLRSGKEWDLARKRDGLFILPPPDHSHYASSIHKGDLEHFHHHLDYLEKSSQRYVLISGSHTICNVNYNEAFRSHKARQADITILYKPVQPDSSDPVALATTLTLDGNKRVIDMEVNPGQTAAGNISMEMLIMSKALLLRIIENCIARGDYDFMKDGIVKNVSRYKVYGFSFPGYIAKINSVQAYYQANMNLLKQEVWQELFHTASPIYTKIKDTTPANYRTTAEVRNSLVANGCIVAGQVENSILFRGVRIHKGAQVKNSIVMQDCEIGPDTILENIICDKDVIVRGGKCLTGANNYIMVIRKGMVV